MEPLPKLHLSGMLAANLHVGNCQVFVSAPAREPDVWHAEADVRSLKVYWKVSFHKGETETFEKDRADVTLNRHTELEVAADDTHPLPPWAPVGVQRCNQSRAVRSPSLKFKVQPLTTMAERVLKETRQFRFTRKTRLNRSHVSLLCFPHVTRRRRTFPPPGGRSRGTESASAAGTLGPSSAPTSAQMSGTTPSPLVPDVV